MSQFRPIILYQNSNVYLTKNSVLMSTMGCIVCKIVFIRFAMNFWMCCQKMFHFHNDSVALRLPYLLIDAQKHFKPVLVSFWINMIRNPCEHIFKVFEKIVAPLYHWLVWFPFNWDTNIGILDSIRLILTHYPCVVHFQICFWYTFFLYGALFCIPNWQAGNVEGFKLLNLHGIIPNFSWAFKFLKLRLFRG